MKKAILGLLAWSLPFLVMAQTENSHGISWAEGLTWKQVKQKARQENKYIFIDAFATWCGPCKSMDQKVYTNDTVVNFFKEHFISIRAQMDKTDKDNAETKSWYSDVTDIGKTYRVTSFPTFIFLSPEGNLADIETGYKPSTDFLKIAQNAIVPGKVYENPYSEYDQLVKEYKLGVKHYEKVPYMVKTALKLQDNDLAVELVKDYNKNYILNLQKHERYNKGNIEMWASFSLNSKTQSFQYFYNDASLIDKIIGQKGYAEKIVDRTIMDEIIRPFFNEQNKNPSVSMSGMMATGANVKIDSSEADWDKLQILLQRNFNVYYTERNMVIAKMEWYEGLKNVGKAAKYYLEFLDKFGSIESENFGTINNYAFDAFTALTDKKIIDGYMFWMHQILVSYPNNSSWIDTYANLLYKANRKSEAIDFEIRAINAATGAHIANRPTLEKTLEQMKRGIPTYDAVWGYK